MEGILDGVALVADPLENSTIEERLQLSGDSWGDMLLDPTGKPFGIFHDALPLRQTCWNMVLDAEALGAEFQYVGFGRVDYFWWANHPPLAAIDEGSRWARSQSTNVDPWGTGGSGVFDKVVWVPNGEDYGGINDRFALADRKARCG